MIKIENKLGVASMMDVTIKGPNEGDSCSSGTGLHLDQGGGEMNLCL